MSVDEEGLESVGESEDVRLPVDVDALRLGVQVEAHLLVQVAVDDQLHVACAEVGPAIERITVIVILVIVIAFPSCNLK